MKFVVNLRHQSLKIFHVLKEEKAEDLKKTECEESECALEMENNEIVIHDA